MSAEHRTEPSLLDTAVGALDRSRAATLEASHELLAHYSDTGDTGSQRAVNTLVDHAADALRAVTDSLREISDELKAVAMPPAWPGAARSSAGTLRDRAAEGDRAAKGTAARLRPARDHRA